MKLAGRLIAFTVVGILLLAVSVSTGPQCKLDRRPFETLVAARMANYASTGDSWSKRAQGWVDEISSNIRAGRATGALDGTYGRYTRYCMEGDDFMAGLTLGEWIGIGLRAPK